MTLAMTQIIYIQPDGSEQRVEAATGANVMRTALTHNVDGIVAECGGAATCGTCHVYVDATSLAWLPPVNDVEAEMLDYTAAPRQAGSRLSCQLFVPEGVAELRIHVPAAQN